MFKKTLGHPSGQAALRAASLTIFSKNYQKITKILPQKWPYVCVANPGPIIRRALDGPPIWTSCPTSRFTDSILSKIYQKITKILPVKWPYFWEKIEPAKPPRW